MTRFRSTLKRIGKWTALAFGSLLFIGAILYVVDTGPEDISVYPPAATSPYRLPWAAGQKHLCAQGNRGVVSHRGWEQFAYDFSMSVGTDVCAARGGTVVLVIVNHDGHGYKWPNNVVAIQHEDGTVGWYLHLRKDGSRVKVGDQVKQGEIIAESGFVGNSLGPHLHFHVTDARQKHTLPVSFSDVPGDAGIPRMFKTYTSGNDAPR